MLDDNVMAKSKVTPAMRRAFRDIERGQYDPAGHLWQWAGRASNHEKMMIRAADLGLIVWDGALIDAKLTAKGLAEANKGRKK